MHTRGAALVCGYHDISHFASGGRGRGGRKGKGSGRHGRGGRGRCARGRGGRGRSGVAIPDTEVADEHGEDEAPADAAHALDDGEVVEDEAKDPDYVNDEEDGDIAWANYEEMDAEMDFPLRIPSLAIH